MLVSAKRIKCRTPIERWFRHDHGSEKSYIQCLFLMYPVKKVNLSTTTISDQYGAREPRKIRGKGTGRQWTAMIDYSGHTVCGIYNSKFRHQQILVPLTYSRIKNGS